MSVGENCEADGEHSFELGCSFSQLYSLLDSELWCQMWNMDVQKETNTCKMYRQAKRAKTQINTRGTQTH